MGSFNLLCFLCLHQTPCLDIDTTSPSNIRSARGKSRRFAQRDKTTNQVDAVHAKIQDCIRSAGVRDRKEGAASVLDRLE